jgi:autotransporter-associated beta strand protein
LIADSDGVGQLDIGYLTLDAGSDDLILRGYLFLWSTANNTVKPYINGTGGVTIESTGTAFGQGVDARWFYWNQDDNQISSLTIGKSTNTENVGFSYTAGDSGDAATISVNGPIKAYTTGTGTVTLTANLVSASGTSLIQGELEGTGDFTQTTGTLQVNATGDNTSYTGDIKGDGAFTKLGDSILALSGANTYTGDTTISAGTLTIDGSGTLEGGDYDGAISNSGTFIYSSTTDQILAGAITGTGALTKQETSTLRLSGTNTYSGITTVSAGTLDVYTANSLGSGSVSLANGTKFISTSGGSSKTFANDITLVSGTIEISIPFGSGSDFILSGDIDGSGKIKLTGDTSSRWLRLTGTNTFSGGIDITSDTATNIPILEIGSNNALGSGTITSYGTVDYQNIRFAGNHTVSNAFATSSSSAKLNFNTNGYSPEISGMISGSGPVTKSGTGTLTLSGNNTYTGATTVNVGTLKVTTNNALGTTAGPTTVASGATLDFANINYATTEAITVNGGTIATSSGTSIVAGAITLGTHSTFDVDGTQLTVSGNVTDGDGIYNITKTGDGILVLSNTTNSYDGTTTISAGTLTVTGRLDSGTYSANIINNSALIYNSASAQTFAGEISGNGTLEKANASSTLTLSGTNTYTGDTTISAGTLTLDQADNTTGTVIANTAAVTVNGGILNLADESETIGALTLTAGSITGTNKILTGSSYTLNPEEGVSVSIQPILAGSGINLTKSEDGTATLSGANTYTGTTTINDGTLTVTGTLSDSTDVSNSGIYDVDTTDTINSLSGTGAVEIASGVTLTTGDDGDDIISGIISGDGSLTKAGTGRLTLEGANDYTGTTTISEGYLRASHSTALGTTAGNTSVANGAVLELYGGITIGSGEDLTLNGTGVANSGALHSISGNNEYQGPITLSTSSVRIQSKANTLTISGDIINGSNNLIIAGSGNTTISGVIGNGLGGISKIQAGTLTLTGNNSFTGTLTVTSGTVILDDADGDTGTVLSDSASVTVDGGIITVSDTSETVSSITKSSGTINGLLISSSGYSYAPALGVTLTISEVLSGSGGLTMSGAGTLVLTAANTFTGNITISEGTLKIDGTGTLEEGDYDGTISNEGTLHYSSTTDQILRGVISSTGALTKDETSTLTLSAANTYTGATTIDAGTLTVSGTLSDSTDVDNSGIYDVDATDTIQSLTGTGAVQIASGQTLTTGDTGNDEISGIISGAGNLTKAGSGTLTLSGVNNYTGITTIDDGTISIGAATGLGATPGSADADNIILKGGTLNTSASFTLGTNKGITLSTGNGTIDVDSGITLNYGGVITGSTNLTKDGDGSLLLSGTSIYSGDTAIDNGEIILTGALSSSTDLTIAATGTLDLRADQTFNTLTISGAGSGNRIENGDSNTIGSLTVTNAATLAGNIVTIGSQTYSGAVTLGANTSVQVSGRTTSSTTTETYGEGGDVRLY